MSVSTNHPLPPVPSSPTTGTVRRHHTISASSRTAREMQKMSFPRVRRNTTGAGQLERRRGCGQDWVSGVGSVGEKTSLDRQSSLPTRYDHPSRSRLSEPVLRVWKFDSKNCKQSCCYCRQRDLCLSSRLYTYLRLQLLNKGTSTFRAGVCEDLPKNKVQFFGFVEIIAVTLF